MNWKELWMTLFGTCEYLGLNMEFWGIKPKNKKSTFLISQ